MSKQHQDTANELYSISSALESAICLKRDPSADDLVWSLIAWAQGTAEETADSLMRDEMNTLFCAEVREMIDRGDDPGIVLAQEREQRLGAAQ